MIPKEQKEGILDVIEMIHQAGFLLVETMGLRPLSKK